MLSMHGGGFSHAGDTRLCVFLALLICCCHEHCLSMGGFRVLGQMGRCLLADDFMRWRPRRGGLCPVRFVTESAFARCCCFPKFQMWFYPVGQYNVLSRALRDRCLHVLLWSSQQKTHASDLCHDVCAQAPRPGETVVLDVTGCGWAADDLTRQAQGQRSEHSTMNALSSDPSVNSVAS